MKKWVVLPRENYSGKEKEGTFEEENASTKEKTIPPRSAEKPLEALALKQLLQHCHNIILHAFQKSRNAVTHLSMSLFFSKMRYIKVKLTNPSGQKHSLSCILKMVIFTSLLSFKTFYELVCSWIAAVKDCYILYSLSFTSSLTCFSSGDTLDSLNESGEGSGIQADGSAEANITVLIIAEGLRKSQQPPPGSFNSNLFNKSD